MVFSENVVVTVRFVRAKTRFHFCTGHLEEQVPFASRSRQDAGAIPHFVQLEKSFKHNPPFSPSLRKQFDFLSESAGF